eukprot:PLAT7448.1.p1 GENE.PLAT7448.1~~PLAT7448.1.p1  ORF type:complete len:259 (-),score=122.42 PLAT7448.1:126-902(-)
MTRGPKKHLKRINAPHHWMLDKMGGTWAVRPSAGPHKLRECLPLAIILRQRLKYALSRKDLLSILKRKLVKVDGRARTDFKFPAGFMDVITIPKTRDAFRLLYDTKGRFVLNRIEGDATGFKLGKVTRVGLNKKGVPYLVTHDGRTIRYPDPVIKVNDTVKIDLATGKVTEVFPFAVGHISMCTKGRNTGRIGILTGRDRHPGSYDVVYVTDKEGNSFATRLQNVMIIGSGWTPAISPPRDFGIKRTIVEEREKRARK